MVFELPLGLDPGKKLLGLHVNGSDNAPKPNQKDSAIRNAYLLLNLFSWIGGLLAWVTDAGCLGGFSWSPRTSVQYPVDYD